MIIAIDGYSSTGKSTLAKNIAKELKINYVDSGSMYRAITKYAINHGMIVNKQVDKTRLINALKSIKIQFKTLKNEEENQIHLNGENVEQAIREIRVSKYVSQIAQIDEVRAFLVAQQREMAQNQSLVMDGRDIGTVVFPNANVKLFITAQAEIRAKRRYQEMQSKGQNVSYEQVLSNLQERDLLDTTRINSPLIKAKDAYQLDTSKLSAQQTLEKSLQIIQNKTNKT